MGEREVQWKFGFSCCCAFVVVLELLLRLVEVSFSLKWSLVNCLLLPLLLFRQQVKICKKYKVTEEVLRFCIFANLLLFWFSIQDLTNVKVLIALQELCLLFCLVLLPTIKRLNSIHGNKEII